MPASGAAHTPHFKLRTSGACYDRVRARRRSWIASTLYHVPYPGAGTASAAERVTAFLRAVYGWMAAGLAVTAVVGLVRRRLADARLQRSRRTGSCFWGLLIAQLGVVFYLSARVQRLAPSTAAAAVPRLLRADRRDAVLRAAASTPASRSRRRSSSPPGMFGALALYGTVTQRSLAGLGSSCSWA